MGDEIILVVDDNRQIAQFLTEKLLPSMGFETLVAYDGASALQLVRSRRLSLILLDLQLPDITGLDLLRQLAGEGLSVPTILATAHGSEQVAADAFRLGVHDYLVKPVDPDTLEGAINRSLAASRLRREKEVLTGQLTEKVAWLEELSKIGKSLTSTLELDEVLRRIVELAVRITQADEGFLALLDDKSGQMFLRAFKNLDQEESKTLRLPVTDTLVGSVLSSREPLRMNCQPGDDLIKVSTGYLVNNLLHVPVIYKDRPLGVLSVDNRSSMVPFKEIDETTLTSLADYAAAAIENASLYQKAKLEISERKRVEHALRESETRFALALRGANDGLWDWNLKANTIFYSPRWTSMIGYTSDDITSDPQEWFSRIHSDDIDQIKLDILAHVRGVTEHFENEHRMKHKDGDYRWMLSRGIAVFDENGVAIRMAGSMSDITNRKTAEQKLIYDALHDALTGLPNRALFMDRLSYAVERAKRLPDYFFAVLFLDLDRFKDFNDSLGHMLGDKLLIEVSKLLIQQLRSTDTVARLGGDEFVILLDDIEDIRDATRIADRIQNQLSTSLQLSSREVYLTTSTGIVMSATGYERPEDVLRDADIAMYRAKTNGKARYEIFDSDMRERIIHRLSLEADLRQGIDQGQLLIYYQPIMTLETGLLAGFEALVRWQHPKRGLLYPDQFIHLAEETGLIISLDRWVLREACRQMAEWHDSFPTEPRLKISVNLSGKHFNQPDLVEYIYHILDDTGLDPSDLKIEITERAIMDNIEMAAGAMKKLQNLGVHIEVDDFGVGHSSLSYLAHLPIDTLKVDQSFVRLMSTKGSSLKIVQAIVMLAHGLGMSVVAEGVETEEQLESVKALGCEKAQGYFLGKPNDHSKCQNLLRGARIGENMVTGLLSVPV